MKTASAKAKGRNLQKWVRDNILNIFHTLTENDVASRGMGQQGTDIVLSEAARVHFPFAVECKSLKSIAVYKYYEQAKSNAKELEPILFIKQNNDRPLVILDATYFFNLFERSL